MVQIGAKGGDAEVVAAQAGSQPTEQEHQHLAAVREQFTLATRFDEDD